MKPIERINPGARAAVGAHHAHLSYVVLAMALCGMMLTSSTQRASAQNALIHHTITQAHLDPPATGREFWWAIPSNFFGVDEGGKYINIYITSAYNTTAYVGIGTTTYATIPITALQVATFKVPEPWELESSGDVGDNAVHVWSKDADLTVYFMSHNLATSDGAKIIPTIGWGTDYVVAGYESLFEGTADYPSEFTIAANTDNTVVTVTPSCDFRATGDPTTVAHHAGQTFNVRLDRGQSVQFMSVQAQDVTGYDVTGTILHSNNPIGVIGGAMCTNIPINFQYCDHVEDMIPPVRTWAETYYGTYFTQPVGQQGHDYAQYLFISSKPGQVIWRENKQTPVQQECTIPSQYGIYWDELELAQKFWSDAPFLMVEYINSSSYPDQKNGNGDPAEVVVNPREQYTKTVVFQTPASASGQRPFVNYATVIVNVKDAGRTLFDGKNISPKYISSVQPVDDTFEIFTIPNILPGTHIVTGDSAGAGVYLYGYGFDESYAWGGGFGTGTFHATDTISPRADTMGLCYDAFVHLADSGVNPGGIKQSLLNKIQIDSDYNMAFNLDTDWAEGVGLDTSGYGMSVLDLTKPAYLQVSAYDIAGNVTTIKSTYSPNVAVITPPVLDFGTVSLSGSATLFDTIRNTGMTPFQITELKLELDTAGFTLVNADLSPLAVDSTRILEIQFSPKKGQEAYDTIHFGNECLPLTAIVEGNAGAPDFSVDDQSWINVPLQKDTGWVQLPVIIHNKSTQALGVKFNGVSDKVHFYLAPYQKDSVTVPAKKSVNSSDGLDSVWFIYQPTAIEQDGARGDWQSPDVLNSDGKTPSIRNDSLHGNPITAIVTFAQNIYDTVNCAAPGDTLRLAFILNNAGSRDAVINRVIASDMTNFTAPIGVQPNGSTWDPTKSSQPLSKDGGTDTIVVSYPVPIGVNRVDVDTLTEVDAEGDSLKVVAQIVVQQLNVTISPSPLDFGQVAYQGLKVTKTITITNPNPTPVTYTSVFFGQQSGNSNASFSISTTPPLPVTLTQGQSLAVNVTLDPSVSFAFQQEATMESTTNACSTQDSILVFVHSPGPTVQSSSAGPILACNHVNDSITITNATNIADTIVSITWLGPDSSVFTLPNNLINTVLDSNSILRIPVIFSPNAADSNLQTYNSPIEFAFKTAQGGSFDTVPVQGTASYATAQVISKFATPSSRAGNQVELPMNLVITHPGFAMDDTDLDITGVHIVYLISNPDLLNIDNNNTGLPAIQAAVTQMPAGWSVQPGSYVSKLGDTLVLNLQGPKITNADRSFGQIAFRVMLPKLDSTTNVTLDSLEFFSDGSTSGCITPVIEDSNFSLILECGDPTLRGFMQGKGIIEYIRDASPNPVTGSTVTFNYGNQTPTNLTLTIYDVLGHAVARPVDNIYHEAGSWQVSCNVARLPSGTYTYRLSADGAAGATVISKQFVIQR